jgi:hypothetical protein
MDHLLTEDERRQFSEEGYLIVKNAIPQDQCDGLEALVDEIHDERKQAGFDGANLFFPNFVGRDQQFIDLLDLPTTFPKVFGIMGWNVYLYHSHLGVTTQEAPDTEPVKQPLGFHQDSGRVNREMEFSPRPMLSLKIGFWLSDVSQEGRGNFHIVPGSHLWDTLDRPEGRNPDGAIPVLAERGDAVFFDRRLWHARSPNHSSIVRKGIFYGYGYRWIRTKDDMTIRPDLFNACDPIQKQILGHGTNCNGFFSPQDDDVPLKLWMEEHLEEVPA